VLAAEEKLIVDIIEALNDPVAPRLCLRDKYHVHPQVEAQTNEQPEAAGVAVGASTISTARLLGTASSATALLKASMRLSCSSIFHLLFFGGVDYSTEET